MNDQRAISYFLNFQRLDFKQNSIEARAFREIDNFIKSIDMNNCPYSFEAVQEFVNRDS